MGLTVFFFTIFAILGVSLWNGLGHYRCYLTPEPISNVTWPLNPDDKQLCNLQGGRTCPPYVDHLNKTHPTYCRSRYDIYDWAKGNLSLNPPNDTMWKLVYNWTSDYPKLLDLDTDIAELNYGITNLITLDMLS